MEELSCARETSTDGIRLCAGIYERPHGVFLGESVWNHQPFGSLGGGLGIRIAMEDCRVVRFVYTEGHSNSAMLNVFSMPSSSDHVRHL